MPITISYPPGGGGGAAAASGALTKIAAGTVGAATGTVTVSDIPATYYALKLVAQIRSNRVNAQDLLMIQPNGDTTGANYRTMRDVYQNGSFPSLNLGGTASMAYVLVCAGSAVAGAYTTVELTIPNYAGTAYKTQAGMAGHVQDHSGAGGPVLQTMTGQWNGTAPISSLGIGVQFGSIEVGSTYALYGLSM